MFTDVGIYIPVYITVKLYIYTYYTQLYVLKTMIRGELI